MSPGTAPRHPHPARGPEREAGAGSRGRMGSGVQRVRNSSALGVSSRTPVWTGQLALWWPGSDCRQMAGPGPRLLQGHVGGDATGARACLHRITEPWNSPGWKGAGKIIGPIFVGGSPG